MAETAARRKKGPQGPLLTADPTALEKALNDALGDKAPTGRASAQEAIKAKLEALRPTIEGLLERGYKATPIAKALAPEGTSPAWETVRRVLIKEFGLQRRKRRKSEHGGGGGGTGSGTGSATKKDVTGGQPGTSGATAGEKPAATPRNNAGGQQPPAANVTQQTHGGAQPANARTRPGAAVEHAGLRDDEDL